MSRYIVRLLVSHRLFMKYENEINFFFSIWITLSTLLKVLFIVVIGHDLQTVSSAPLHVDDYWPCTRTYFASVFDLVNTYGRPSVLCDQPKNYAIVKGVFTRNEPVILDNFWLKIPQSLHQHELPRDLLHSSAALTISLSCEKNTTHLKIERDAFASSKLFTENLIIDNCDLSQMDQWDFLHSFHFLKRMTFIKVKNFSETMLTSLPELTSLSEVNFFQIPDFNIDNNGPFRSLPSLIEIFIDGSPVGVLKDL